MASVLRKLPSRIASFSSSRRVTLVTSLKSACLYSLSTSTKLPPNYTSSPVLRLPNISLPTTINITPTPQNVVLAKSIISGLRTNNIIQIHLTQPQQRLFKECLALSKAFFQLPTPEKQKCIDDRSFAGYIASGEEITAGKEDYSEIFTVMKDLPLTDWRVQANWPCHGPCPWPNSLFKTKMNELNQLLGQSGEILLQLLALGLGFKDMDMFTRLTKDGWHHTRVLRFPALQDVKKTGRDARGIGAHTDYGLLVFALAETIGGDFVKLSAGSEIRGSGQNDETEKDWRFIEPKEDIMTCFPGDMLQLLTNNCLLATPHKVALNTRERFAFAYFHEPNFDSVIETLPGLGAGAEKKKVHYGTHFTDMFLNNYGDRITAHRIREVGALDVLEGLKKQAFGTQIGL